MSNRIRSFVFAGIATATAAFALPQRALAAGEIYWFSLLSEDVYSAMDFYENLFGWRTVSSPTGGFIAFRGDQPFAGLNSIQDRMPGSSESLWLAAITVDDVPAAVRTARSLGAKIHEDVTEVKGWGFYALIQDPQGAPLLLVNPARPLGGTQGYSGWRWAELWTHDPKAAAEFYTKLLGYELESVPVGAATYDVFRSDGKRNAGLVKLDRRDIAPRWAPYIGVTDLRGVLVRVWDAGGKVLREPAEVANAAAGADRVALIADPSGAALFLYQLDAQASADPVVAAETTRRSDAGGRAADAGDGGNVNVSVSVSVGYGFGTGWGSAYPAYPGRPFGPRF